MGFTTLFGGIVGVFLSICGFKQIVLYAVILNPITTKNLRLFIST